MNGIAEQGLQRYRIGMPHLFRCEKLRSLAFVLCLSWAVPGDVTAAPNFDADVQPYFQAHCLRCHGEEKQEGEFRLDKLSRNVGRENTPQWAEVMERISSGEMPPKEQKTLPTAAESAAVVEWLAGRIKEGEAARMALRGRVSYNRLTRDEYVNTVQDLIGVHFDATDPCPSVSGKFSELQIFWSQDTTISND